MPKKTRKEKQLAELRRRYRLEQTNATPVSLDEKDLSPSPTPKHVHIDRPEDAKTRSYFIKDLTRSMIGIALILILEGVIYFSHLLK